MNGIGAVMSVDIVEYKKSILDAFEYLTEIEIKAHLDVIKSDPERFGDIGTTGINALKRCREMLKIIMEKTDERTKQRKC